MSQCPCGLEKEYDDCCGPIIGGERQAATAQELMRSRYTAYALGEIAFISKTTDPERSSEFDEESAKNWAENSEWHGLEIVSTLNGESGDETGQVEFVANYSQNRARTKHHEMAEFRKMDGQWFFVDGQQVVPKPVVRETPKVGRNEPCPCGSGKKFKKCCG